LVVMARLRALLPLLLLGMSVAMSSFPLVVRAATINVPADYATIQGAINAASTSDTIIVAAGVYHEHVLLNKSVNLQGVSRDTTILDGDGVGTPVTVTAQGATLSGFTTQAADLGGKAVEVVGVNNVIIISNTISSDLVSSRPTGAGVDLYKSNFTTVDGNVFSHNLYGVNMTRTSNNRISNNRMVDSTLVGVEVVDTVRSVIFQNRFENGEEGIDLTGSLTGLNNFTRNVFRGLSLMGVFLVDRPSGNMFVENTFELDHWAVNEQNVTVANTFYHNSFLRSGLRHVNHVFPGDGMLDVWDNRSIAGSGPKGGNYWDDYSGVDSDGDGIGNTNLPADGVDSLPLMVPFVPVPIAVVGVTASPMSGSSPLTVSFQVDVLGSLKPFSYLWSFGDNSSSTMESGPSHTYSVAGNYTVRVIVRDSSGASEVGSATIMVSSRSASSLVLWAGLIILGGGGVVLGLIYYRRRKARRADGVEGNIQGRGSKTDGRRRAWTEEFHLVRGRV